jgi:RNA polymerase sigma-70 factor (ECF subfamily)
MKGTSDQGGDRQARDRDAVLGASFQEHAAGVYRFIYAKVGSRAVAEDLTSQVFREAVRWLGGDYGAEGVRSWLYATARAALADHWRAQSQYPGVPLAGSMALLSLGGDEQQEVAGMRERARRILDALPPREGSWADRL